MGRGEEAIQWRILELAFRTETVSSNPWTDIRLTAVFEGPRGQKFTVSGFHDGGSIWKVRFAPTEPGEWGYVAECNPPVSFLRGRRGSFHVEPAGGTNPLFLHGGFLKVSGDRHFLTYSDGTPFFWLADTWWFCPSDLIPFEGSSRPGCSSTFKTLVDTRRAQGYSVAHMAFCGSMTGRSVFSFWEVRGSSVFDADYWRRVDRYMDYANESGILPAIATGWGPAIAQHGLEDLQFLWRYIIARYGAHAVTWLVCGEYNQKLEDDRDARLAKVFAIGRSIKQLDPYRRAMKIHPWGWDADKRQVWDEPWYDFIFFQGGHYSHGKVPPRRLYLEAHRRTPTKPVLEGEVKYEGIDMHRDGLNTDENVRHAAYQAIQSCGFGFSYGAHGLWYPNQNAEDRTFSQWGEPVPLWEALARPGGAQMQWLRRCYESVRWWELVPRPDAVPLEKQPSNGRIPLAKMSADGTEILVYFPPGTVAVREVRLEAGGLDGTEYDGRWLDPRTGESVLPTHSCAGTGCPDVNDWILILKR